VRSLLRSGASIAAKRTLTIGPSIMPKAAGTEATKMLTKKSLAPNCRNMSRETRNAARSSSCHAESAANPAEV